MPNPNKEQLKQTVKDLKEQAHHYIKTISELEEELSDLKMLTNTPDAFEKKNIRVQLHGGTVKELLQDVEKYTN